MGVDKFNYEGYFDPTTYEALTNIHREEMAADKKAAYLPLVYVCSPYAGDVETNVKNAKRYSRFAVDENAIPVTPHLLYPQFMDDGNDAEREMAMHFNYVLLGKCTEVWVFGGVISRGMAREISVAKKRRMKIRWFTEEQKALSQIARDIYMVYPFDGKYILDQARLIICQSNAKKVHLKNSLVLGRSDYQWQHEPVLYGFLQNGKHYWSKNAGRSQTTIWNFDKPKKNKNHPTSKPLDLLAYPIGNSSQENAIVIDTFGGSGSTLMTCEQTNRVCHTMELDEKYASVILRRYVEDTGDAEGVFVIRDGEKIPYSALVKEVEGTDGETE